MTDTLPTDDWADRLRENREEKDRFFSEHPQSPIPPERREGFDGLAYFDPDPEYRVEATVTVFEDPDEIDFETSDGRTITYRRPFRFSFEIDGDSYELSGYRQEPSDPIFVPFRDKTTGQQSYKDGRYMELEPEEELSDGMTIEIDFNLAYSPFCAYSETFSCPLPPEENWLDTTIPAGERTPPL
ncbi:DUF1684 domain-containing protein [Halovenus sp. WSH3]|uniref:DUF1684 domain-containing protein n=1 Tax=Halovenus carboxidivorans TaxID=2692199 RepID=A0A6B0SXU9_9EURY|nr:DUF1684 domain-containing protein [Halovenus carboxidivorans]MXR50568.1 DUF1684 domain-containing protein [Halovenus carboxidivorans]